MPVHKRISISVQRQPKESSEKLIQRFQKKAQAGRIVVEAKALQRFHKPKKKTKIRMAAMKREEYRAKREREKFY